MSAAQGRRRTPPARRRSPLRSGRMPSRLGLGRRMRRPGARGLVVAVAVVAILGGGFLWFRQSSLVAVRRVTITGVSGPDVAQIRAALRRAALGMSTMGLDVGRLHAAVAPYPVVRSLRLAAQFPHGLRIAVSERVPVAVVQAGGRRMTVSADGTLLPAGTASATLPTISEAVAPGATHVTGTARDEVTLLAAAPYPLLARIATAGQAPAPGLMVTLRNGPAVYFGSAARLDAKWSAVTAVLASATSAGADYIDVTDPARPAAGTGSDTAQALATTGASPGG